MLSIYRRLSGKLRNILLYNGDVDPSVDQIGSQRAAYAVGLPLSNPGAVWRPWFYNMTGVGDTGLLKWKFQGWGESLLYSDAGRQLGGYVIDFENNFTYVTIHGSGHMVPEYKPQAALQMFKTFLDNGQYAPFLKFPTNL